MKIYVRNIADGVTEEDIKKAFEVFGKVDSVSFVRDESAEESMNCAFVEMLSNEEALAAIAGLSESELKGRAIQANRARTGPIDRRRPGRGGGRRKGDPKPGETRK